MANLNMVGEAEKYIALFDEIKKRVGDERIAQTILSEVNKDRRMSVMKEEREEKNGEPATAKQLQYLKNLGVETTPGLTKKQASILIDNALDKEPEVVEVA